MKKFLLFLAAVLLPQPLMFLLSPQGTPPGAYNSGGSGSGGTNFGATTVIVSGGAGGLSGTSGFGTTANVRYFVAANDTETAELNPTAANITVEMAPGVTIRQLTGSTNLFHLGNGANNFTIRGGGLSTVSSGTCAPLVVDTPATPVNNITLDNVELNANSSTCTDSGAGFVNISGGSHHSLDVWSPAASDHIIVIDNSTPATHNPISDVTITTRHGDLVESSATGIAIKLCPNNQPGGTAPISLVNIDATVQTADTGFKGGWNCNGLGPIDSHVKMRISLTGSLGNDAMFSGSCAAHCQFDVIVDDNGIEAFGGGIIMNDSADFTINGIVHETNSSSLMPFQALDSRNFTVNLNAGGDTNTISITPVNGWSTTQPCMQIGTTTGQVIGNITIGNVRCLMPPSSTADCLDVFTSGANNPVVDNLTITPGLKCLGASGAGSKGISLTNTATGGSQSFANAVINNPWIRNFVTGLSIGAGVNQTQVNGALITGATTPVSDSGTNSRIWTHRVQTTGTLASGTLAVTFSGNDVWTGATTYSCNGSDQTTVTNAVSFTYTSATAMTITGTASDVIRYQCWGY